MNVAETMKCKVAKSLVSNTNTKVEVFSLPQFKYFKVDHDSNFLVRTNGNGELILENQETLEKVRVVRTRKGFTFFEE